MFEYRPDKSLGFLCVFRMKFTGILDHIHGPPIEIRKKPVKKRSAYTKATWTFKMSYEREFYGLSEYVRF